MDTISGGRKLRPDFALLKTVPARGIMVTALSDSKEYDFVSRFFAPAVGINEDPVTGSAHCCLGPYWQKRLKLVPWVVRCSHGPFPLDTPVQ
jgi:predicted PhzF superfamily epimerase YddE/YHI9